MSFVYDPEKLAEVPPSDPGEAPKRPTLEEIQALMAETCDPAEIEKAVAALKAKSKQAFDTSVGVAREIRRSRSGELRAVVPPKPGEVPPAGDLTGKFAALAEGSTDLKP